MVQIRFAGKHKASLHQNVGEAVQLLNNQNISKIKENQAFWEYQLNLRTPLDEHYYSIIVINNFLD